MDQLRLILLILGVALIAGIFVWELYKKRKAERRRAQIVAHLSEDERSLLTGESVLGEIGQADPFEVVQPVRERRSHDHGAASAGVDDGTVEALAEHLESYDIDEDFPGEPAEEITRTPAPPAMSASPVDTAAASQDGVGTLSGLAARRDGPEQLDLTGLDLAVPERGGEARASAGRRGPAGDGRRESDTPRADAESVEELHIVMTVMAKTGEHFTGNALRHALEHADLVHGEMNIFHRHEQPRDHRTPTLFSAANVLAPGHFEPARMDSMSSPGIAMFMRLPGPEKPVDAFQKMLDAAQTVAQDLNGTLCDETRSTLTPQSINHLRERIADFGRRQMLKA